MASKRSDSVIILHKPVHGGNKAIDMITVDGNIPSFIRNVICDKVNTLVNKKELTHDILPGYVETLCNEVMVRVYNNYGLSFTKLVATPRENRLVVTTKDEEPFDIWLL